MEEQLKQGVIYLIEFPDKSRYVGQSKNYTKRMLHYSKLDCSSQPLLYSKLQQYGYHSSYSTIIDVCDYSLLNQREIFHINELKTCRRDSTLGLNILKEGYSEYLKIKDKIVYPTDSKKRKSIVQYNIEGIRLRVFKDINHLYESLGVSKLSIRRALRSKSGYFSGYIFRYESI